LGPILKLKAFAHHCHTCSNVNGGVLANERFIAFKAVGVDICNPASKATEAVDTELYGASGAICKNDFLSWECHCSIFSRIVA
jgi:hypothetical protein